MKAWAMTERQASIWSVLSMSKTNWGFFRMLTQNLRGRLHGKASETDWMSFDIPRSVQSDLRKRKKKADGVMEEKKHKKKRKGKNMETRLLFNCCYHPLLCITLARRGRNVFHR